VIRIKKNIINFIKIIFLIILIILIIGIGSLYWINRKDIKEIPQSAILVLNSGENIYI